MRKERARGVEEAHRPPRAEDPPTEAPAATPSNAGDDTPLPNHSEVSPSDAHRVNCDQQLYIVSTLLECGGTTLGIKDSPLLDAV